LVFEYSLSVRVRALWFAVSTISSLWFLYWICYDVFVWNKELTQVGPANFVGLIMSIILAIIGFQLEKVPNLEKLALPLQRSLNKSLRRQQILNIPTHQEAKNSIHISQDSDIPSECKYYLGYLHTCPKSVEIPEECLKCEHVANCLSPLARIIECRLSSS
jgi:hypothetical protein